jgi:hypothetical protein
VDELTKLCREIERSNATLIQDKEYAIGRLIAFKIEHPSASDASKIYAAVASARESLPDTPNLRREFQKLSDSMVGAYYDFERQLKYVYLRESNRTDIPITLTELYLTHGDTLTISDKGSVSYRADAPSRSDDKWGTAKSWASKRYSHLFSSEETGDSQVSP